MYSTHSLIDVVDKAKEANQAVLVHCRAGVSRSASIVMSYLMMENSWKFHDTLQFVREKRSIVRPNQGFVQQLLQLERTLAEAKNKLHRNEL